MSEEILVEALDDSIIVTIVDTDGVHEMTVAQAIGFRALLDDAISQAQAVRSQVVLKRAKALKDQITELTQELKILGIAPEPAPAAAPVAAEAPIPSPRPTRPPRPVFRDGGGGEIVY